jgi:hypothetical protein
MLKERRQGKACGHKKKHMGEKKEKIQINI